jgi:hypothetical protein
LLHDVVGIGVEWRRLSGEEGRGQFDDGRDGLAVA